MSREFKDPEAFHAWQPVAGLPPGAWEIILYRDPSSGTYSRFLRVAPGFPGSDKPLKHDFDEVVYVIKGRLIDCLTGQPYSAGSCAFFPAGQEHGPHTAPEGALMIEFRHYKPQKSEKSD